MSDLTFTRSGEFEVVQIEGKTDAGIEFVDGYVAPTMVVADAGRIVVPTWGVELIEAAATRRGLTIEHETAL